MPFSRIRVIYPMLPVFDFSHWSDAGVQQMLCPAKNAFLKCKPDWPAGSS